MNRSYFFLSWILISSLFLVSCGPTIKVLTGLPNLGVHTQQEIDLNRKKLNGAENIIDAEPIKSLNETEIKNFSYLSFINSPYIFDYKNNLLCFKGDSLCVSDQLDISKNTKISESYTVCDTINTTSNITEFFGGFENVISKLNLNSDIEISKYEYKVLYFINSDISKDELPKDWEYIYTSLNNDDKNTVFIRIWTDLNEEWGLNKNSKVRTTVRKVKGHKREFEIFIKKLPLSK